jgi:uncharacterized protein Yka (UPF0111/DUF47 family)
MGRADSIEKFYTQIEAVEKEIDDLEYALLDQARAAAASENH